jgi:AcrR family transcriptional regulator
MSPRPRRSEAQTNLSERIIASAWKQIGESGAAALSLRAIARELGITAPAIYNYFPDRDSLVTALITEAFNSLADSQEAAVAGLAGDDFAGRLSALGLAYRQWAVTHPQRYQLIFGTPIPKYHAPEEITLPAAARSLVPLTEAVQAIYSAGRLRTERLSAMTPKLEAMLKAWQAFSSSFDLEVLYLTLIIWSRVHGMVSLEIGNQLPSFIDDPAELFQREMDHIREQYL